jgi:AraC-like DNA-binding protein
LEKRDKSHASTMSTSPGPPRGVLHPHLQHGKFEHVRRGPSPWLADRIEHYWYVSWDLRGLPAQQQETLPHPNVHYVVEAGLTAIYGVHTRRYVRTLEGQSRAFGIKFKAGGFRSFYEKPVSELMDRHVPAAAIFGAHAEQFESSVSATDSLDAMISAAETLLLAHPSLADPQVATASSLVAQIAADRSLTTVDALVELSGLNKRSLQRLFHNYVGVHPKWVINRYRLHEVVAQLQAGAPAAWSELALALGYFDQAHFIRDFRHLVGRTPAEYVRTLTPDSPGS